MGLEAAWNIRIGRMPAGPRNLISDVPGVTVGHCTIQDNEIQTGVTALLPHGGNLFREKVLAASHVINGFGKSMGLIQIDELGTIETPIILTNTLSAGTAYTALVRYMLSQNSDIGDTTGTVNPIVCECNDGYINDIRSLAVQEHHVMEALRRCGADFEEGAVGAGRGMSCHQMKGGIGSASRVVTIGSDAYTVGALLLTNHGMKDDLLIANDPIGRRIPDVRPRDKDKGSCIILIATDAPLSERQLKRICKRAVVGLSRTGSYIGNGSGEIAIAFTTANRVPHYPQQSVIPLSMLHDENINGIFRAVAEAVEESVLSSMLHAGTITGFKGRRLLSLSEFIEGQPEGGKADLWKKSEDKKP